MAVLTRQLYFEGVKVGDELPPLVKPPVDRIQIARYAGASQDYSPLHVDEQFARAAWRARCSSRRRRRRCSRWPPGWGAPSQRSWG